jgi:hypothetical protein
MQYPLYTQASLEVRVAGLIILLTLLLLLSKLNFVCYEVDAYFA